MDAQKPAPALTELPGGPGRTFLDFPLALDLDRLDTDFAILGIPYGLPYHSSEMANDQSRAPDALRAQGRFAHDIKNCFNWDLNGTLLDGRQLGVVDCGNVTSDPFDHHAHYRRAEAAARKIFEAGATLISIGGDHGVPIPVMRALEQHQEPVTLIQIDAHLDWRQESHGVVEGFRSPMRRASEMAWIGNIVQIGLRGTGSLNTGEVNEARAYGSDLITAYEVHDQGMDAILARIPDGGLYYLTIDADALDPSIMPAVLAKEPGGLTWHQIHKFIHGIVRKGRVVGMDLVELAPSHDVGDISVIHAERLICNFIGACARAGYHG